MDEEIKKAKTAEEKERAFLNQAMRRLKESAEADEHNRKAAKDDLDFLNGEQWDLDELNRRRDANRPALVINHLNKYVDQIVGDMRQNRARVKVRPVDSVHSNISVAKIRSGLIANIEYMSNSESVYDTAGTSMVECGYGAWRVLTRYTEENPFIQEIYLESIPNALTVVMDHNAKDFMYADANYGFILDKMPIEKFKEEFPDKDMPPESLGSDDTVGFGNWFDAGESVTVAEYFVKDKEKSTMCLMDDGSILPKEDADRLVEAWDIQFGFDDPALATEPRPVIANEKQVDQTIIRHYKISAAEILSDNGIEGEKFPGKFIPIVLVRGKLRNVEGKTYVRGLIREAKDPQRVINFWESSAAEIISLAPKSPWIGTPKQFEGFENDYATANIENFPFLKYNPDPDVPGTPPRRVGMGEVPMAVFTQVQRAEANLKSVIGLYNRDVGDAGPEVTGRAILAAQKPGDTATFVYPDNLSKAIAHSGRIINEMIPEVYDTERDVRVRHFDETETFVPVNTSVQKAIESIKSNPKRYQGMNVNELVSEVKSGGTDAKFNDITAGKYDVVITVGPSYSTQRQESAENMLRLVNADPNIMRVAGDLVVDNLDFKDAEELSARIRKTLPQGLAKPKEGDEPPTPPQPTPDQILEQEKLQYQKLKTEAEGKRLEIQKVKLLKEAQDVKGNIRKEILAVLQELHGPTHKADEIATSSSPQV